jgi:hypothetical protein
VHDLTVWVDDFSTARAFGNDARNRRIIAAQYGKFFGKDQPQVSEKATVWPIPPLPPKMKENPIKPEF